MTTTTQTMTRTDKVKAYNVLTYNQRRRGYPVGSAQSVQCGSEMIQAMNKLTPAALRFVNANFADTKTDWVEKLSTL